MARIKDKERLHGLQTTLKNVVLLVAFLVQLLLNFFSTFVIIVRDYEGMDFR
jgi:hypothetical protein